MSQFQPLESDEEDDTKSNEDIIRRKSTALKDLPAVQYFDRWCGCISCCTNKMDKKLLDTDSKTATEKLIYEECIDKTIGTIVSNFSWVNAMLLRTALMTTMYIDMTPGTDELHEKANNAWIYFFTVFIVGLIIAILPRTFEDIDEVKRELNLEHHKKKVRAGDEDALAIERKKIAKAKKKKKAEKNKRRRSSIFGDPEMPTKILHFVEVEANELGEKFEDLFIATISNIVSMGWRDAATATLSLIVSDPSAMATANFFYAIFMTTFGIYTVIRIGDVYDKKETQIGTYLDNFDPRYDSLKDQKKTLLRFAFVRRTIKLSQAIIQFAIAWAWRNCIKSFIIAIYGESNTQLSHQWGYTVVVTLFVAIAFSFSEHYFILYPKTALTTEQQKAFLEDKARKIVNGVIYANFSFVVGMAWYDSLILSLGSISGMDSAVVFFYWCVAIGGITMSVIGKRYITKWGLHKKIEEKGMAQALFDTFERFYDPECNLHVEGDSDFVPLILDAMGFQSVELTVGAWGIAGSMGVTNAVVNTMIAVVPNYNPDNKDTLYAIWIAVFITMFISLLVTSYFARLITLLRETRRKMFKEMKEENEKEIEKALIVEEETNKDYNNGNDGGDDDDDDEQKKDDDDVDVDVDGGDDDDDDEEDAGTPKKRLHVDYTGNADNMAVNAGDMGIIADGGMGAALLK